MAIIDGKALAVKLQAKMTEKVVHMKVQPSLLVILVGEDDASQIYVRNKARVASKIGIRSETVFLSETTTEDALIALIDKYNHDDTWHGILVQLPLPKHINEQNVLMSIDPAKDVDGFHPLNMGQLFGGNPIMVPSTPAGIMAIFKEYDVTLAGKHAVVIGRSNIVGKPITQLMLSKNATVTMCHSQTKHLQEISASADILVSAIGCAKFVTQNFVKKGAVVIDVGMNRDKNGKLCGDVDFEKVKHVARLITPVPGGVGPMTITMLMEQTIRVAEKKQAI